MDCLYEISLKSNQNTVVVLVEVTITVMKCHVQEHGGEERVNFTHGSVKQFIIQSSEGKNSSMTGLGSQGLMQRPRKGFS